MNLLILSLAVLSVGCSILEQLYENELEDFSAVLISFLQTQDYIIIQGWFKILEVITAGIFIYLSLMIYFCSNRLIGATSVCSGLLCAVFASFLKMCFAHPRPIWKYENIKAFSCPRDFGFPSGHAFSAGGVIFFISYHWIKTSSITAYKLGIILLAVLTVGVDRLYLGAHFLFQVISGNVYSALVVSIIVHPVSAKYIKRIFRTPRDLIILHISGILLILFSFVLYCTRNASMDPIWSGIYKDKCGKELSYDAAILKNFDECTVTAVVLGFCLGYHLSYRVIAVGASGKNILIASMIMAGLG